MSLFKKLLPALIDEVWPNPLADNNAIIKATFLSKKSGALKDLGLPHTTIKLPNTTDRFIVLELGAIRDSRISLSLNNYVWYKIDDLISSDNLMLTLFTQGRFLSTKDSYICSTANNNILLAVSFKYNLFIQTISDPLFVRFYKNVAYMDMEQIPENKLMSSDSFFVEDLSDDTLSKYGSFRNKHNNLINLANKLPLVFRNGYYIGNNLPSFEVLNRADVIYYLSDPYIYSQSEIQYLGLNSYYSNLDNVNKLILSIENLYIDEFKEYTNVDDLELFIRGTKSDNTIIGAYVPRLNKNVLRNLTYKDWAINVSVINNTLVQLESNIGEVLSNVKLVVLRRFNTMVKSTVLTSDFIQDIMELPISIRNQIFSGANSNFDLWKAQALEASRIWEWCSLRKYNLDKNSLTLVFSRYGLISLYEGIKKLPGSNLYNVPPIYKDNAKIVTYNTDGLNPIFTDLNGTVEPFIGEGYEFIIPKPILTGDLEILVPATNDNTITLEEGYGVFCYYKNGLTFTPLIVDIDYTLTTSGNQTFLNWIGSNINKERYVRISNKVILRNHTLTEVDYLNGIDVYTDRWFVNEVGMEQMMLWYKDENNDFRLMSEGLDFNVRYGKIFICKQMNTTSELIIYYAGLPNYSLRHEKKSTWGILKNGKISNDDFYNLFLNRNKLFFIDGKATKVEEIRFAENFIDKENQVPSFTYPDGTVYNIITPPTFGRIDELDDSTNTIEETTSIENQIVTFLSAIYPQNTPSPITIVNKYTLVSMFLNRIINDVIEGIIVPTQHEYDLDGLNTLLSTYLDLLPADPCSQNLDDTFVRILPRWDMTPVAVSTIQFSFINIVNQLLLSNQVVGINICLTVN